MVPLNEILPILKSGLHNQNLQTRFLCAKILANSDEEIDEFISILNQIFLEVLQKEINLKKENAEFALVFLGNHATLADLIVMHNLLANPNFKYASSCYICINANKNFELLKFNLVKINDTTENLYKNITKELLQIPGTILNPKGQLKKNKHLIFADERIKTKGHLIHKLKAKDTTGRWAYYFVMVELKNEKSFIEAINGDGTIDLDKYGIIIASNYGEEPTTEVKNYLKEKYGFDI